MPYSIATPQMPPGNRNYLSTVDIDIDSNNNAGSGVYIGGGIILTAGHVIDQSAFTFATWSLSFAEGNAWQSFGGNIDLNPLQNTQSSTSPIDVVNYGNYGGFFGEDVGLISINSTATQQSLSSIPQNSIIVFSDPSEASGLAWTGGYVDSGGPVNIGDSETLAETSSNSILNLDYITSDVPNNDGNIVRRDAWVIDASTDYQIFRGFSGSGFWLEFDLNNDGIISSDGSEQFLAGIVSQFEIGATYRSIIEPLGDSYQELANTLFGILGLNPNSFATNVLIADMDGSLSILGNPSIVQGTGFNEHIHISPTAAVNYEVRGEGGNDMVFYGDVAGPFVAAIANGVTSVVRSGGETDTLLNVEGISGTSFSDQFFINAFTPFQIIGGSVFPPPGNLQESASGPRLLSAAEVAAASGMTENLADQDTVTVAQSLLDSGAAVTYLSDLGEGVIWLGDQRITYTGVFNEPVQDPDDSFQGLTEGSSVGLNDIGEIVLDFSGSVEAVTSDVLNNIPLFNLVDSFIGSDLGDVVDLGLTGLEDFIGGAGDDTVIGTAADNILSGGAGDDVLTGGDGDDILTGGLGADDLNGGAGNDTADYSGAASGVRVDIVGALPGLGEAAGDIFTSIENITGSDFQDQLYGTTGANIISAGAGNDLINGRGGADIIDGGAGLDRYYFGFAFGAATLDLSDQSNNAGQAAGASFTGIEQFFGSLDGDIMQAGDEGTTFFGRGGDDMLTGGAGIDRLFGGDGDDIISGGDNNDFLWGGEGADAFDGGDGFDRVNYNDVTAGVVVYLTNPALNQGAAAGDTHISIEALWGSNFNDIIVGSANNDQLAGNNGNDALSGGGGRDLIFGGNGNDRIIGGAEDDNLYGQAGNDTFVFNNGSGRDVIYDFVSGADEIEFLGGPAGMADLSFAQVGSNLQISSVHGTIILFGLTQADISADDFIFTPPPASSHQAKLASIEAPIVPDEMFIHESAFMIEASMVDMGL